MNEPREQVLPLLLIISLCAITIGVIAFGFLGSGGHVAFVPNEGSAQYHIPIWLPKPSDYGLHEGDIIGSRSKGDPDIFIINDWGYKRLFLNPAIFGLYGHLHYSDVHDVRTNIRDAFVTSGIFRNCETNAQAVWALEVTGEDTAALHHIAMTGEQAAAEDPEFFHKVFCINSKEESLYPKSPIDYTSLSQLPNYARGATPTPTPFKTPIFTSTPLPLITISGRVFNQATGDGFGNATILTCLQTGVTSVQTNSSGYFTFQLPYSTAFCLRLTSEQRSGYDGPFLNYPANLGSVHSYEYQVAGFDCPRNNCSDQNKAIWDLPNDTNFTFAYRPAQTATPTPLGQTATPTPTAIPTGSVTPISGRAYNATTGQGFGGVTVVICLPNGSIGTTTTNFDGSFSYQVPKGAGYCVRLSPESQHNLNGPILNYPDDLAWAHTYEWQVANHDCSALDDCGGSSNIWDMSGDTDFDFAYYAGQTPTLSNTPTPTATYTESPTMTPLPPVTTMGLLRVLSSNPRYFSADGKTALLLGGFYSGYEFADNIFEGDSHINFDSYVNFLKKNNLNHIRLWLGETGANDQSTEKLNPVPYMRSGTCCAGDGGNKFDLDKFNPAYFDRLRSYIGKAREKDVYVSIMLFNGWDVWDRSWNGVTLNPMKRHPYAKGNNINGVNGDSNGDGSGAEIHSLGNSATLNRQRAFVRRVIDTVNGFDNVLYEISNEDDVSAKQWQYEMIRYINQYEASKPKQHPIGMSELQHGSLQDLLGSSAQYISPAANNYNRVSDPYVSNPPVTDSKKVVLLDADHIGSDLFQDAGIARSWAWKSFMRGYNPILLGDLEKSTKNGGAYDNDGWAAGSRAIGQVIHYAQKINLAAMTPRNTLSSSNYALASDSELISFMPSGSSVTVNLSAMPGSYAVEWFDVVGGNTKAGSIVEGGNSVKLSAPSSGTWVVYLRKI